LETVGSISEALVTVIIGSKVMYTGWIMGIEVLVYVRISATSLVFPENPHRGLESGT